PESRKMIAMLRRESICRKRTLLTGAFSLNPKSFRLAPSSPQLFMINKLLTATSFGKFFVFGICEFFEGALLVLVRENLFIVNFCPAIAGQLSACLASVLTA